MDIKDIEIINYNPEYKKAWDDFITASKNGTFLFYRDFMEYHSDRFEDHSILFTIGNNPVVLFPANIKDNIIYSHEGLTYGGIISDKKMSAAIMLNIFDRLISFCKSHSIKKIVYKAIPHIFHTIPAEEDLYALFRNNARLIKREISSTIVYNDSKISFKSGKRQRIKKMKAGGFNVLESTDYASFMDLVRANLNVKYGVEPTHTAEEMKLLTSRFPEKIKLYTVSDSNTLLSGAIMYEWNYAMHAQYIAGSIEGKKIGAIEFLLDYLINELYTNKTYFDFGISTEKGGTYLNEGLIKQKEEYGGRGAVYDTYEIDI